MRRWNITEFRRHETGQTSGYFSRKQSNQSSFRPRRTAIRRACVTEGRFILSRYPGNPLDSRLLVTLKFRAALIFGNSHTPECRSHCLMVATGCTALSKSGHPTWHNPNNGHSYGRNRKNKGPIISDRTH